MTLTIHDPGAAHPGTGAVRRPQVPRTPGTPVLVSIIAQDQLTQSLTRLGLRRLGPVAVTATGHESDADVLVVIADQPDESLLNRIQDAAGPGRPVLLVCRYLDEQQLMRAIDHGVRSVLDLPTTTLERLVQGIVDLHAGSAQMPGEALGALIRRVGDMRSPVAVRSRVSEREVSVMRLVADGLGNAEIARELSFSERTVKNVVAAVSSRFHLTNRAHLVSFAYRHDLI